ncbi:MAG TPA: methyltransferase domain-containing protein [Acidimicrobiales bacterium]
MDAADEADPTILWRSAADRSRKFDAIAQLYDTYRPGYPDETFDDLISIAGLGPGDHLVEIGAGTGIATEPLARRGLSITCLEPGLDMAAVAREKLAEWPGVTFIPTRFEDWDVPSRPADAVVAANSWHWVDPEIGFPKSAATVREGGCLCVIFHRVVSVGPPGFAEELRHLRAGLAPPTPADLKAGRYLESHRWSEDMDASGYFEHVQTTAHAFTRTLSASEFVAVSDTYGPNSRLTAEERRRLADAVIELIDGRFGGAIDKAEEGVLYVGRKTSS